MLRALVKTSKNCLSCRLFFSGTTVCFSDDSPTQSSTARYPPVNRCEGLDTDKTWEAEVIKHERDIDQLRKQGVGDSDLPELNREEKVKNLPHLSFREKPKFDQDESVLDETSDLLLGETIPSEGASQRLDSINNIDPDFVREDVQELLQRIHYRCAADLVYKSTITERKQMPTLRYLTDNQLKEEMEKIRESMNEKIEMPLVMLKRKTCNKYLSNDDILDGYEDSNLSFVDISENIKNRERFIVVRETNGKLRKANWDERDRLINLYYPVLGRKIVPPLLFKTQHLENVFEQNIHENALDQCVIQFEPDSPKYLEIFEAVYRNIEEKKYYHLLRATRYFGGLVYFLTKNFLIDSLILDMLQNNMIEDAVDCIRLLTLLHPNCKTKSFIDLMDSPEDITIIKAYIENESADKTALLQVLQNLKDPTAENKSENIQAHCNL
ncbi:small ribosomal subunit protein mS22-like [Styela clava]